MISENIIQMEIDIKKHNHYHTYIVKKENK